MNMSVPALSPDFLIAELQARGLHYLTGALPPPAAPKLSDDELLAALAQQQDARVRSALIPLFLQQPYLVKALPLALQPLAVRDQAVLKTYYTAAMILQEQHKQILQQDASPWQPLPDLFGEELGVLPEGSVEERLRRLGAFYTQLTGLRANWPGTYRHAVTTWIRHRQRMERWAV